MKRGYCILLAALTLITACKKDDYSGTSTMGQPVFTFTGTINNSPVIINAGLGNYYMNTSYALDSNGIYTFTGEFMNVGCSSNCPNSLEFYFKDNRKNPPTTTAHVDSIIATGSYNYAIPAGQGTFNYVAFATLSSPVPPVPSDNTDMWNYGDGTSATYTADKDPLLHYYPRPGTYTVTLTMSSTVGGVTQTSPPDTNIVAVGVPNEFLLRYICAFDPSGLLEFSASPLGGTYPYSYYWTFGDGSTSTLYQPSHTYSAGGIYKVSGSCTDGKGYTTTEHMNVIVPGTTGFAGGFYEEGDTSIRNIYNLSDIGVLWYDNNGKPWTSINNHQHTNSSFQVTAVSDYQKNPSGQAVKSITAKISCELYNGNDSIPFSGTTVFGVAHY